MSAERGRLGGIPGGTLLRSIWQFFQVKRAVHGRVSLGHGVRIGSGTVIRSLHGLDIHDGAAIGRNCTIEASGTIGFKTVIAANVGIVGRNDHAIDEVGLPIIDSTWVGDRELSHEDVVSIGDDVWIGYGATVLSGVSIGTGAVVAAGAVVVHDVEPFAVVGGNPARKLAERFAGSERERHLRELRRMRGSR